MAARSSKGIASQVGFAVRAASIAAFTWLGVAEAYSATVSWCFEGLSCLRDFSVFVCWHVSKSFVELM